MQTSPRLARSRDKMIAGVCGGLAEYFNIDPAIVRLIFVVAVLSGVSPLVYLILWIVMPAPDSFPVAAPLATPQLNVTYEGQENWNYDPFTGQKVEKK